jgi:hypothetical protein
MEQGSYDKVLVELCKARAIEESMLDRNHPNAAYT